MTNLIFSINIVAPVFIIILIGVFLKQIKIIDDVFVSKASSLVYKTALPVLIFTKISKTNFITIFNGKAILIFYAGIFSAFLAAGISSIIFIKNKRQRGAFIQGSFWGNSVIVGLALVLNVFGDSGAAIASIMVAFLIPVFNLLAVIVLTMSTETNQSNTFKRIMYKISGNPLIIAVVIAMPFSIFSISLPVFISVSLSYLARMALPLALVGIGGSLSFSSFKDNFLLSAAAAGIKIVLMPIVVVFLALRFGVEGRMLGILFIISATPTAISSFIMAQAMENDSQLAANIIVITTLGSIFTIGAGIYILKSLNMLGI